MLSVDKVVTPSSRWAVQPCGVAGEVDILSDMSSSIDVRIASSSVREDQTGGETPPDVRTIVRTYEEAPVTATPASARFEFRLRAEAKRRIERAAALQGVNASDFARSAVEERAEQVLREHDLATVVPADFFDDLLRSLDEPTTPNPALAAAAKRLRKTVERR